MNLPVAFTALRFALVLTFALALALPAAELKRWPVSNQPGQALAVQAGDVPTLWLGQFAAWDATGRVEGDPRQQSARVLANLRAAAEKAGARLADVVRINAYVTDDAVSAALDEAIGREFAAHAVAVTVVRTALSTPGALIALDAVIALPTAAPRVESFMMPGWPKPVGGAHGAVLPAGAKTFFSGQADKAKGAEFRVAVRNTLTGLGKGLESLSLTKADIAQVKAFFKPFERRSDLEAEIAAFFAPAPAPPVVLVEFRAGVSVEIELVVAGPERALQPGEQLRFSALPDLPNLPQFSRAVLVEAGTPLIFFAGLYGNAGSGGNAETKEIFSRLGTLLFEVGGGFRTLVRGTSYVTPDYRSTAFRDIRPVYYDPTRAPASSSMSVTGVGRPGHTITLQLIAAPRPVLPSP